MGIASFTNSRIVMKFGMRPICIYGFLGLSLISLIFLIIQLVGVQFRFGCLCYMHAFYFYCLERYLAI
jgi:DHA1 family bicyclomycin/chloramphenicol resistance-like MFS transporter